MEKRCTFGDMRLILEKDRGYLQGHIMLSALSKIQRQLGTSNRLQPEHLPKLEGEYDDCSLAKVEGRPCMNDIKGLSADLVFLFTSPNRFTCHAAAKTFLLLLQYFDEVPFLQISSIQELWDSSKAWFCDAESTFRGNLSGKLSPCEHKRPKQQKSWSFVAHLLELLHNIFRNCKVEGESKLGNFLTTFEPCIKEFVANFSRYFLQRRNEYRGREEDLALAALLRFLCSITHAMGMHPDSIKPEIRVGVLESINEFTRAISQHCISSNKSSLCHYLQHKFLMLLFRLCEWFKEHPSLGITCINLLEQHLDVLCGSLFLKRPQASGSLIRSPFAKCMMDIDKADDSSSSSSSHEPEKYAVFLIFKAVVSLKIASRANDLRIEAASRYWQEPWLLCWLTSQVNLTGNEITADLFEVADIFASSYLEIFIDEDTLLMDMLLVLLDTHALEILQGVNHTGKESSQDSWKLVIETFKPVRLFAIFTSLIHYDHLVILDFLISNDTSVRCLQYLTRSLRIVNNAWTEFLSLPQTDGMRNDGDAHVYSADIKKVAECIISLKQAVERLHSKKAFPYNPSPLLKRLNSFKQLWDQSKADRLQMNPCNK